MSPDIVVEYVGGGTFQDEISLELSSGGLPECRAQDLTYQICEAVSYVHSQGVLHRDLKPENILLTSGNPKKVKVADFGLSKAVSDQSFAMTLCGTSRYMAPEVAMNKVYDSRADSYSLGCIVFLMLTGHHAHPGLVSYLLLAEHVANRSVVWENLARRRLTGLSEIAVEFIKRLLQHDPEDRMRVQEALSQEWLLPLAPTPRRRQLPHDGASLIDSKPDEEFYTDDVAATSGLLSQISVSGDDAPSDKSGGSANSGATQSQEQNVKVKSEDNDFASSKSSRNSTNGNSGVTADGSYRTATFSPTACNSAPSGSDDLAQLPLRKADLKTTALSRAPKRKYAELWSSISLDDYERSDTSDLSSEQEIPAAALRYKEHEATRERRA